MIKSFLGAARRSELGIQSGSWTSPIVGFFIGVSFLAFPAAVSVGLATLFGSSAVSDPSAIFAYGDGFLQLSNSQFTQQAVESFALVAQLLGYIAFARGLYLLNAATSHGAGRTFGPGATFLVAGIAAVNFPDLFKLVSVLILDS